MECAYPPCHRIIEQPSTGRRKRYCSEAHKHADYRRRHPERLLKNEIKAMKSRMRMLEYFARKYAPDSYRFARDIPNISLEQMIEQHAWNIPELQLSINRVIQAKYLKPKDGILDAYEQETFYTLIHGQPGWRDCKDCPHGVIP